MNLFFSNSAFQTKVKKQRNYSASLFHTVLIQQMFNYAKPTIGVIQIHFILTRFVGIKTQQEYWVILAYRITGLLKSKQAKGRELDF
jgi:hypothetical protein